MPRKVNENRTKVSVGVAITTVILCLIPIGIIAIVNGSHPGTWNAPYPQFILYFSIVCAYFAIIVGFLGQINMVMWYIVNALGAAGTIALLVVGYVTGNPVFIHLATSTLFMFMMYFVGKGTDDNIYVRYTAPLFCILAALISLLLCVHLNMSTVGHIAMASVFNGIYLIVTAVSVRNFFRSDDRSYVLNNRLAYEEETEEEISARKLKKYNDKMAMKAINAGCLDENGKPDIEAYKELLKQKEEEKKARKEENKFSFGAFFKYLFTHSLPGSAPSGSEDWDSGDWARYICDCIESAANITYGTTRVSRHTAPDSIEITVSFDPRPDLTQRDYGDQVSRIQNAFDKACKHCPYSATLDWD